MVNIITVHSARAGTGKSMIVANVATLLAAAGRRVGVIDADLQTGNLHNAFGLAEVPIHHTFNDYLLGLCDSAQAAYDVTPDPIDCQPNPDTVTGQVFLVPASTHAGDLDRILREGYNIELVTDGLAAFAQHLNLDVMLIDTHPGINEEMMLSLLAFAIADTVAIVLRLDQRDYQGTGVTVDVARTLGVPRIALVVNQVASMIDLTDVQQQVMQTYGCDVIATIPYTDEVVVVGSTDIFARCYPEHPVTHTLTHVALNLLAPATTDGARPDDGCLAHSRQ